LAQLALTDLTPLFHWNTKQIFLYVQAEYENAKGVSVLLHHPVLLASAVRWLEHPLPSLQDLI
jgi:hypothetical protein